MEGALDGDAVKVGDVAEAEGADGIGVDVEVPADGVVRTRMGTLAVQRIQKRAIERGGTGRRGAGWEEGHGRADSSGM